jgi:hypothetical protein
MRQAAAAVVVAAILAVQMARVPVPRIEAVVAVEQPIDAVWDLLIDLRRWGQWNPVFSVDFDCTIGSTPLTSTSTPADAAGAVLALPSCHPHVGTLLTITCKWDDGTVDVSHEVVRKKWVEAAGVEGEREEEATVTATPEDSVSDSPSPSPRAVCWEYVDMPSWLLSTDRCITVYPLESGGSRVVNHEQFGGPLATIVMWLKEDVVTTGFHTFNAALRDHLNDSQ